LLSYKFFSYRPVRPTSLSSSLSLNNMADFRERFWAGLTTTVTFTLDGIPKVDVKTTTGTGVHYTSNRHSSESCLCSAEARLIPPYSRIILHQRQCRRGEHWQIRSGICHPAWRNATRGVEHTKTPTHHVASLGRRRANLSISLPHRRRRSHAFR